MDDILDNMTEEQKDTLKQFRRNLKDVLTPDYTDYLLVKFLRAKNFNLKAAEKIFRVNYYNRITFSISDLPDTYEKPEVIRKYEPAAILGFAKDGSLLRYMGAGHFDFYGAILSVSSYDLCIYVSQMMECDIKIMKNESLKTGKEVHETTFIVDLEGFSIQQVFHKCVVEMGIEFIRIFQDTYPEIWRQFLIINVPAIFDKAFNLFKPFMNATALGKIKTADKGSSKSLLLKHIDEDVLPVFLGGNRVDCNGDPECKEFINFGGKIPEKMYSKNIRIPLSSSDPEVKCFTVGQRSVYNICIPNQEVNTLMRFQLRSENGSISFSMFYKEFSLDHTEIELPKENECLNENSKSFKQITVDFRIEAHCTQENFTIPLQWTGIYVLQFNNISSWFTTRKLLAKIELLPPKKEAVP